MPYKRRTVSAMLILGLATAPGVNAATITWTGSGGNNSWHTPSNWNLNRVPGAGDDVVIPDMTPNVIVTYSSTNTSINSLTSAEAFTLSGGTLTIDSASSLNSTLSLSGGTLTGAGDITVNAAMFWTIDAMMSGTGRTIIASTGSLALTDFGTKTLGRRLENHSANASLTGSQVIFNNGTLSNESDGTFTINLTNNTPFLNGGGTNAINNAGTLNKIGAGTLTFNAGIPFNNTGTVNLDAGGLTVDGGGTNSAVIDADAGTTLNFGTPFTHGSSSSLIGQGTLTFSSGTHTITGVMTTNRTININTVVSFNAPYTFVGTLNLSSTLGGSGNVTITGTLNWTSNGQMSGTGRTIISSSGSMATTDFGTKTLSRTLENHSANAGVTGSPITFNNGTLSNESDGTFTVNLTNNTPFLNGGGTNAINNAGTLNKVGAGTLTLSGVPFNNGGIVNLDAGGLTISGGGTNSAVIDADAGTTLNFTASYNHGGSSSLTGQGTLKFNGGAHTISGVLHTNRIINIGTNVNFDTAYTFSGTVNLGSTMGGSGDATITGTLNWTSNGQMAGAGRTIIASGGVMAITDNGDKTLSRVLENHSPNANFAAGRLVFNNGTFNNASDGTLTASGFIVINSGGSNSFINAGTFTKTGTGTLTIGAFVPLTNSGTINVQAGILSIFTLTNYSGTTLTGGTYLITSTLQFTNANITDNAANIILDGPASAILDTNGPNGLANFATNAATGSFQIKNGRNFVRNGSLTNLSQVRIGPGASTFSATGNYVQVSGVTTLDGGTLDPTDLVNIQAGELKGNGLVQGNVTNGGTITVDAGTLSMTTLTNLSGTTLTGGTYNITGILKFGGANIATNAGSITLDGPASAIQDLNGANGLANLAANAATGSFQIKNGRNFTGPGTFTNLGQVRIGPGADTLSATGNFVQSAGATTLDGGSLDPTDLVDLQGGELKGNGSILGTVKNGGICKPGFSPGSISINGDYTQTVAGRYEAEIGGTSGGAFDTVSVTGRAILPGTLVIVLISGFVPAVGDAFDILSANTTSVKFTNIVLPVLPNLKGWRVEATSGALRLTVIDCGPGDADGDGVGDACDTAPDLSWHTIDGGGATFSSGGTFKVGATIGQPDAGDQTTPMTGGIFTLVGGFWSGIESPSILACSLVGDVNVDGARDGRDIQAFVGCELGNGASACPCADVDESGTVDTADVVPFVQILLN